jgi:small subunit ribosomal protein S1
MSYSKRVMRSDELIHEGERITVMIKDVDPAGHRISLSLKDAGPGGGDPWALLAQKFPVGTILPGKVEKREAFGLFIRLDEGVTGLLPKSKALEAADFPYDKLKVGETVTIQVAELRLGERRISLQPPKDPGSDDWKGFVAADSGGGSGFGTLADKLKAAMEKKKK